MEPERISCSSTSMVASRTIAGVAGDSFFSFSRLAGSSEMAEDGSTPMRILPVTPCESACSSSPTSARPRIIIFAPRIMHSPNAVGVTPRMLRSKSFMPSPSSSSVSVFETAGVVTFISAATLPIWR